MVTKDQSYYLMRRLHSLTGVVPVGLFLLQHIYGNALALSGAAVYNEHVHFLIYQPLIYLLEASIFLPLIFHSVLGIFYSIRSKQNVSVYRYQRNWMYSLQRLTGLITLVFVIVHVLGTRFSFSESEKHFMYESMVHYFEETPILAALYIVGVVAASFHFCNGMWAFCIMWGITITRKSQDLMFKAMMGLFVMLAIAGSVSAIHFVSQDAEDYVLPSEEEWQENKQELKKLHALPVAEEGEAFSEE